MTSKRKITWGDIDGAFEKKRRLHLVEAEDKTFLCPVSHFGGVEGEGGGGRYH